MSHDHWHGGASGPSKAGLAEAVIVAPGWPRTRRTYLQTVHRLAFVSPPPRQAALEDSRQGVRSETGSWGAPGQPLERQLSPS